MIYNQGQETNYRIERLSFLSIFSTQCSQSHKDSNGLKFLQYCWTKNCRMYLYKQKWPHFNQSISLISNIFDITKNVFDYIYIAVSIRYKYIFLTVQCQKMKIKKKYIDLILRLNYKLVCIQHLTFSFDQLFIELMFSFCLAWI